MTGPANGIVIAAVLLLLAGAFRLLHKNRKQGRGCLGCPYAASCGSKAACPEQRKAADPLDARNGEKDGGGTGV